MHAAGADVYRGTAGIALFLGDMYAATGDRAVRNLLDGALHYSVLHAGILPPFGFFAGQLGVAYVLWTVADAVRSDQWRTHATRLLDHILDCPTEGLENDVVSGAAGAIPALLYLGSAVKNDRCHLLAERLGGLLISRAERGTDGWSWAGPAISRRNLCGFSHGASGIAYALLFLFAHTKVGAFRYAAQQALAYERSTYDPAANNWPDYRSDVLSKGLSARSLRTLTRRLGDGEGGIREPVRYPARWCHGAPGIAIARQLAWRVLREEGLRNECLAALDRTAASIQLDERATYCLCHGHYGSCDVILSCAAIAQTKHQVAASDRIEVGLRMHAESASWPCGTPSGRPEATLLMGLSGIGHFLLRRTWTGAKSPLWIELPEGLDADCGVDMSYKQTQRDYIELHFGRTLERIRAIQRTEPNVTSSASLTGGLRNVRQELELFVANLPDVDSRLRALFCLERTAFDLLAAGWDSSSDLICAITRQRLVGTTWLHWPLSLTRRARLVHLLLSELNGGTDHSRAIWLVYRDGGAAYYRQLSPLAAAVFEGAESGLSLREVMGEVGSTALGAGAPPRKIYLAVRRQFLEGYSAGLLTAQDPVHRPRANGETVRLEASTREVEVASNGVARKPVDAGS